MSGHADLLILGGTGPIGRALARGATDRRVVAVGRTGPDGVDAADEDALERLIERARPQTLAYLVRDRSAAAGDPADVLEGTLRVAARWGVRRVLLASSAAVYGEAGTRPYAETSPLAGTSPYALGKIRAEERLASSSADVAPLSLRVFNVFGPGCVDGLVNRLAVGPAPSLRLTDRFVRDYVHVDDVAAAFLAAADRPDVTGAVNIGRGRGVDNLQLADAAAPGSYEVAPASAPPSYSVADVSRAAADLGWVARVDPLDALRRGNDRLD